MFHSKRPVVIWLQTGMVMVLLMVLIGGITRLTQSGLSMVHWKPLHFLPPLNETQWQDEFSAYQTSPEFIHFNHHFSLEDFKKIYFWEYLHRLIGRLLGIVFIIPFLWFLGTNKINSKQLRWQLAILFLWGALQGFLGWYMVKSGLVDKPHVSHFRLAIHLITAFTMVSFMYYMVLTLKYPFPSKAITRNTQFAGLLYFLILLQITYGALTAGLKAGHVYNTYPLMQHQFLPPDGLNAWQDWGWSTLVNQHAWVQFIHRWWGFSVVMIILLGLKWVKKTENISLLQHYKTIIYIVILQFIVGITTLVFHVPLILALAHQLIAVILLLSVVKFGYFSSQKISNSF